VCEKKAVKELFADVCKAAFGLAVFEKRKVFIFTRRGVLIDDFVVLCRLFFSIAKNEDAKREVMRIWMSVWLILQEYI